MGQVQRGEVGLKTQTPSDAPAALGAGGHKREIPRATPAAESWGVEVDVKRSGPRWAASSRARGKLGGVSAEGESGKVGLKTHTPSDAPAALGAEGASGRPPAAHTRSRDLVCWSLCQTYLLKIKLFFDSKTKHHHTPNAGPNIISWPRSLQPLKDLQV